MSYIEPFVRRFGKMSQCVIGQIHIPFRQMEALCFGLKRLVENTLLSDELSD